VYFGDLPPYSQTVGQKKDLSIATIILVHLQMYFSVSLKNLPFPEKTHWKLSPNSFVSDFYFGQK
jgi:hypothetical protein